MCSSWTTLVFLLRRFLTIMVLVLGYRHPLFQIGAFFFINTAAMTWEILVRPEKSWIGFINSMGSEGIILIINALMVRVSMPNTGEEELENLGLAVVALMITCCLWNYGCWLVYTVIGIYLKIKKAANTPDENAVAKKKIEDEYSPPTFKCKGDLDKSKDMTESNLDNSVTKGHTSNIEIIEEFVPPQVQSIPVNSNSGGSGSSGREKDKGGSSGSAEEIKQNSAMSVVEEIKVENALEIRKTLSQEEKETLSVTIKKSKTVKKGKKRRRRRNDKITVIQPTSFFNDEAMGGEKEKKPEEAK